MSDFEPWEMRLAWQTALQTRGCPPDRLLYAEEPDELLSFHLSVCPFCSESAAMSREEPEENALAAEMERLAVPPARRKPAPGQICRVAKRLGGWGPRGRYFNPPLVLVLDLPRETPGAARVAQVYDDPILAGPGDIPLGNDSFAESWNTYTLREEDLDCCSGCLDEETLRGVLDGTMVDWPAPPPGTHLEAFRRLEVEVAAFFALQAMEGLMERRDTGPLEQVRTLFPDGESLKKALSDSYPQVVWPELLSDVPEMLARARFPESELPLAAAEVSECIPANIAVVRADTLQFSPTLCELRTVTSREDGTIAGGRVLTSLPFRVEIYGQWQAAGRPARSCDESFIDPETGFFRLFFRDLSESDWRSGKLFLLLIGS